MAVTIRLDANAIRHMMHESPEFKLELQKCVIAEITKDLFINKVDESVRKMIDFAYESELGKLRDAIKNRDEFDRVVKKNLELMTASKKQYSWDPETKLQADVQKKIDKAVDKALEVCVKKSMGDNPDVKVNVISEMIYGKFERYVSEKVEGRIDHDMATYIQKEVFRRLNVYAQKLTEDVEASLKDNLQT